MHLPLDGIAHINSVTHEGKVVVVATDLAGKLWYTIRRDGFETSNSAFAAPGQLAENSANWEPFAPVLLPDEPDDTSVVAREQAQAQRLRSIYRDGPSAVAPVQLISGMGHLYIFRQSLANTLHVDRFVLDGLNNKLVRKLEVRYKRSGKRHEPEQPAKDGGRIVFDALDFRDRDGNPFYEPSAELALIGPLTNGWFSVVLLPTDEIDRCRWHIFSYNAASQGIELVSIAASEEGLFELRDGRAAGIIRRRLGLGLPATGGPAATRYDVQREVQTQAGKQWLRQATRVMLAVPTADSTTAIDFAAAVDGTLSRINEQQSPSSSSPGEAKAVLLAPDTLDKIRAFGSLNPAASGTITGLARTGDDQVELMLQRENGAPLVGSTQIEIGAGQKTDGTYVAHAVVVARTLVDVEESAGYRLPITALSEPLASGTRLSANTTVVTLTADAAAGASEIQIEPTALRIAEDTALVRMDAFDIDLQRSSLGEWKEIQPQDTGLVSDGMVTRISVEAGGRLRVHAVNHGLAEGEQVRISGAADYIGTWPVRCIADDHFQLDARWQGGIATNLRVELAKRRALSFGGRKNYIADATYRLRSDKAPAARTHELWFRTTQSRGTLVLYEYDLPPNAADALTEDALISLSQGRDNSWVSAACGRDLISAEMDLADGQWHHVAHTFGPAAQGQSLYVDGRQVARGSTADIAPNDYPGTLLIGASLRNEVLVGFSGEIADVRVWERIRTADEIAAAMHGPLLGREPGLARYWPLGAIVEGPQRKVVDLSPSRRDAVVNGNVFVTPSTLRSTLADGQTPVVEYLNDRLVAVAAGVRYQESFEFRMIRVKNDAGEVISDAQHAQGLFEFRYKGKRSPTAEEWIVLSDAPDKNGEPAAKTLVFTGLDEGWFQATGEFRLAEDSELTMMRSFGIAKLQSDRFDKLEIRKHSLRAIEAGITEALFDEPLPFGPVDLQALAAAAQFAIYQNRYTDAAAKEPTLIAERDRWRSLISDAENTQDSGQREAALRNEISAAQRAEYAAYADYIFELRDPTNYWCWITHPEHGDATLAAIYFAQLPLALGLAMLSGRRNDGGAANHRLWGVVPDGSGHFRITTREHQDDGALLLADTGVLFDSRTEAFALSVEYAKWGKVVANQNGRHVFRIPGDSLAVRVDGYTYPISEAEAAQEWILEPTTEQATQRIPQARQRHEVASQELAAKQDELKRLLMARAADAAKVARWKTYLQQAQNGLAVAYAQLQQFGAELLRESNDPAAMDAFVKDKRGLETRYARLLFINPVSRITIGETADGNVQLGYFDRDGRMRLARYDAAASTDNTTFEQWLPDNTRTCLAFDAGAALTLNPGIELPGEHTIEAWFQAPLPKTTGWNTLVRAQAGYHHVIVKNGRELGIYLGTEGFFGCGFDVSQLQPGWHHLAAVAHTAEQSATTTFYVDGAKVGDVMQAAVEAMRRAVNADTTVKDKSAEFEKQLKPLQKKAYRSSATIDTIGNVTGNTTPANTQHFGRVAELRVWGLALTGEEIEVNSKTELSGSEPGLLAWYPLNGDTTDHTGKASEAVNVGGAATKQVCAAPIGHPGCGVLQFDGARDELLIPEGVALPAVGTIELWVKTGAPQHADTDVDGSTPWQSVFAITDGKTAALNLDTRIAYPAITREWRIGMPTGPKEVLPNSVLSLSDRVQWSHIAVTWDLSQPEAVVQFLVAGQLVTTIGTKARRKPALSRLVFGAPVSGTAHFNGWMAELRLWSVRRKPQELAATMRRRLRGDEAGLIGYWPLATAQAAPSDMPQGAEATVRRLFTPNLKSAAQPATLLNAKVVIDNALPMLSDALVTNEYVTYGIDFATGRKTAMMRRFLATPSSAGVALLAQKRVEQLELKWVGNAQFKPTLLGYIEGAPPVPSENLTVDPPSYNGAASVELEIAEEVGYKWSREQDAGLGLSLAAFFGTAGEYGAMTPVGVTSKIGEFKVGLKGELDFTYSFLNSSTVGASASNTTVDRVELRGSPEDTPHFASIGRRFVPKNIGYAVVVSALADVFVTRLQRSGRMVSYALKAVDGVKPDVNTITFLINPAYTMNGSLDGLTGLQPTSERFFADVPQMRAQYGAVYPASYYRLYEAYDLAAKIDKADADRATYFANFNSRLVDETSLDRNVDVKTDDDESRKKAAKEQSENLKASRAQYEQGVHSAEVFEGWQRKMEDLQVRAGKRNIVNTYVWDADGGTHVESQQFASTVEHTVGSSIDFNGKLGVESEVEAGDVRGELTALATFHVTQTMTKTMESTRTLSLNIDLSGVERQSVADFKDRPYFPGEKVKRYRFMSFYLEGDTSHFDDFFGQVVDPEWLAGNSEGARALREVDRVKKNKTWRVLHRVTYVERPALAGFGRDTRQLAGGLKFFTELGPLQESVSKLEDENKALQVKLDAVLALLRA